METEIVSGIISGATVAPIVSIVDKAIFSNASGKATLLESFKESVSLMTTKPIQFLKGPSLLWIWAVYAATYTVSNCVDRYSKENGYNASSSVLVATSATNIGMSVLKDRAFSRMYGVTAPRSLPIASALCYGLRDFITVGASFTMVEPLAGQLEQSCGIDHKPAVIAAQVTSPIVAQLVNTPVFLLGMDLYNTPEASSKERLNFISKQYWKTFFSRVARIGPAYSIGGIVNRILREKIGKPIKSAESQ